MAHFKLLTTDQQKLYFELAKFSLLNIPLPLTSVVHSKHFENFWQEESVRVKNHICTYVISSTF